MSSRFRLVGVGLAVGVVLALAVGARLLVWQSDDAHSLPPPVSSLTEGAAVGGPFTLASGAGNIVRDTDFQGKWKLVVFGYMACPDVCPTSLTTIGGALDRLSSEQREKIAPLFITVDPERDTPDAVKAYVSNFHPALIGLSGTPEQIASVIKAYRVYAAKVPGSDSQTYAMDHSALFYLMAPDGHYVTHFSYGTPSETMAAELRKRLDSPQG